MQFSLFLRVVQQHMNMLITVLVPKHLKEHLVSLDMSPEHHYASFHQCASQVFAKPLDA